MEEITKVTKALASTFKRFITFMEHLSKKCRKNEPVKKIRDATISIFSLYCEAQISKSPPTEQKEK